MKIEKLFAKRVSVADGLKVKVDPHFFFSTFGVRGRYETVTKTGQYIPSIHPGTGFFARPSDSSSYRHFVREQRKVTKQNLWTLIARKEPSFEREQKAVEAAIKQSTGNRSDFLSRYLSTLLIAKEAEMVDRCMRGIKDKLHKDRSNKFYSSVLSQYKGRYATLQHDVKSSQGDIANTLTDETRPYWQKVVETFELLAQARRLWHVVSTDEGDSYRQVFFDLGVFDYVHSPFDTPVMRDSEGLHYYLYPAGIIRARSNVDFDWFSLKDVDFEFSVVDLNTLDVTPTFGSSKKKKKKHHKGHQDYVHTDAASTLFATTGRERVVGRIGIPQLGLVFFVNRTGPAEDFVKAINDFKDKFDFSKDFEY